MDRVISLLAALVGLIALGGALIVHTNADMQRQQMATEIAQLKASIALLGPPQSTNAAALSLTPAREAPAKTEDEGVAKALLALQGRIASLEQASREQASALEATRSQIAAIPSQEPAQIASLPSQLPTQVAAMPESSPSSLPPASSPSAVTPDGPTKDCIPLGTRFMGAAGDSFPICKTKVVINVAAVSDGLATINGAGDVAEGGMGQLDKGCNVAVFSADLASGYAEMRVSCQ